MRLYSVLLHVLSISNKLIRINYSRNDWNFQEFLHRIASEEQPQQKFGPMPIV